MPAMVPRFVFATFVKGWKIWMVRFFSQTHHVDPQVWSLKALAASCGLEKSWPRRVLASWRGNLGKRLEYTVST